MSVVKKFQIGATPEIRKVGHRSGQDQIKFSDFGAQRNYKTIKQDQDFPTSLPKIKGQAQMSQRLSQEAYTNQATTTLDDYYKIGQYQANPGLNTAQVRSNKLAKLPAQIQGQPTEGSAQYKLKDGDVLGQGTGFSNSTFQINTENTMEQQALDKQYMTTYNPDFKKEMIIQRPLQITKGKKFAKLKSPGLPSDGFKSNMQLNNALDRHIYSSSAQSMGNKRDQGASIANRSSSVSKHALGPIRVNGNFSNGASTLRRSGAKSASKHQTSRRKLVVTNSQLPKNPYFEAQMSSLVAQNQYQNYYSKSNNAWKNTRRINDDGEENNQTYFQGGILYPGLSSNIDQTPFKTTQRSMSDADNQISATSGYFLGKGQRQSSRLTLADIQRIAEQNKQITQQMTNSNVSVASDVERQQQSQMQILQNKQIIKMLKLANENLTQYRAIMKDSPTKTMKKQVKGLQSVVKEASRESSIKKLGQQTKRSLRRDGDGSTERSFATITPLINQSKTSLGNPKLSRDVLIQGRKDSRNVSNQQSRTQLSESQMADYQNNMSNSVVTKENLKYINDISPNVTPRDTGRSLKLHLKRQLRAKKTTKNRDKGRRNMSSTNPSGLVTQHSNHLHMNVIQESTVSNNQSMDDNFDRDPSNQSQGRYTNMKSMNAVTQRDALGDYNMVSTAPVRKQFQIPAIDMKRLELTLQGKDMRRNKKSKSKKVNGEKSQPPSDSYQWQGRNQEPGLNFQNEQALTGTSGPFETQRTTVLKENNGHYDSQEHLGNEKVLEKMRIIPAKKTPRKKRKEDLKAQKGQVALKNPTAEIAALKKQKQEIDAQVMSQINSKKRNPAQEPQSVTSLTNLIGVADEQGALESIKAIGQSISDDTTAKAEKGSGHNQYRLPKLKKQEKTQAQLKREYHQQEFKRHAAKLRMEQSIQSQENVTNQFLNHGFMDYQIKQEPQKPHYNSLLQDQIESSQENSKQLTKFIKANNYANAYDSSSPYSKGPGKQSIESILGIQAQDQAHLQKKPAQNSPKISDNKSKHLGKGVEGALQQTQQIIIRMSATESSKSHEKAPNTANFVDGNDKRGNVFKQSSRGDKEGSQVTQSVMEHEGGMISTITSNLGNSRLDSRVNKSTLDQYSVQLTSLTHSARIRTRQERQRDIDASSKLSIPASSQNRQNANNKMSQICEKQFTNISLKTGSNNGSNRLESPQQLYYQNISIQRDNQQLLRLPGQTIEANQFELDRLKRIGDKKSARGSSTRFSQVSRKDEPSLEMAKIECKDEEKRGFQIDITPKNIGPVIQNKQSKRTKYTRHSSVDSANNQNLEKNMTVLSSNSRTEGTDLTKQANSGAIKKINYEVANIVTQDAERIQLVAMDSNGSISKQSGAAQTPAQIADEHPLNSSSLARIIEEEQKQDNSQYVNCIQIGAEVLQKSRPVTNEIRKAECFQEPLLKSASRRSGSQNQNSVEQPQNAYFDMMMLSPNNRNTKSSKSVLNQESNKSFQKLQGVGKLAAMNINVKELRKDSKSSRQSSQSSYPEILAVSSRMVKSRSPFRNNKAKKISFETELERRIEVGPKTSPEKTRNKLSRTQEKIEQEMKIMQDKLQKIEQEIQNRKKHNYQVVTRPEPDSGKSIRENYNNQVNESKNQIIQQQLNINSGNNSQVDVNALTSPRSQNETQQMQDNHNPIQHQNSRSQSPNHQTQAMKEASQTLECQESQEPETIQQLDKSPRTTIKSPVPRWTTTHTTNTARTIQADKNYTSLQKQMALPHKNQLYLDQKLKEISKEKKMRQRQRRAVTREIKRQNEQLRNNVQQLRQKLESGAQISKLMSVFDKVKEAQEMKKQSRGHRSQLQKIRNFSNIQKSPQRQRGRSRSPQNLSARMNQ